MCGVKESQSIFESYKDTCDSEALNERKFRFSKHLEVTDPDCAAVERQWMLISRFPGSS